MKGVTRVTASLLAAAMTAGLGTTAVLADANTGNVGDATESTEPAKKTSYIEVHDKDGNLLASTNDHEEAYYDFNAKKMADPTGTGHEVTTVDLFLSVGGTKTLTGNVDSDASTEVKWSYKDVVATDDKGNADTGKLDGKIDGNDKVDAEGNYSADAIAEKEVVSLDNGKLTANKAGDAVVYAYASDAITKNTDEKDKEVKVEDNVITIRVHVLPVAINTLNFVDHDTVYTDTQVNKNKVNEILTKGTSALDALDKELAKNPNNATSLKYHGTQLLRHMNNGESAEVELTTKLDGIANYQTATYGNPVASRDDSDSNDTVKYATDDAKYLTVSGTTVTVTGSTPNKGYGTVYAYVDANKNGKLDDDESASDKLVVLGHKGVEVYRVYNPNTGEHLYTTDANERDAIVAVGWISEGTGWFAPVKGEGDAVTRMFNPNNGGEHVYTTDAKEIAALEKAGWKNEGTKFYSATGKWYPLYRQYNPNAIANNHNYTGNIYERTVLVSLGWKDEGADRKSVV